MTDKIEVPRELLERLHRCADFLRIDGMADAADQAEALLLEAAQPDNGWVCKTCGKGHDAFHWGCDTEGWDRPADEELRRDAERLDWLESKVKESQGERGMSRKINYWTRLKYHPGVPMMIMLTPAFMIAGLANESMGWPGGVIVGAIASAPFWAIVLWTARTQPVPKIEENPHD